MKLGMQRGKERVMEMSRSCGYSLEATIQVSGVKFEKRVFLTLFHA